MKKRFKNSFSFLHFFFPIHSIGERERERERERESFCIDRSIVKMPPSIPIVVHGTTYKVHFPFAPYPCQMVMMEKILFALHNGQNAHWRSPTGTGKTRVFTLREFSVRGGERGREREERRKRKRRRRRREMFWRNTNVRRKRRTAKMMSGNAMMMMMMDRHDGS